jgi:hypothetical protein
MKPLGLLLFVSLALAQPAKKDETREVKAIGCVRKGVEGGCLLLRTMDGATTYNIFATPAPPVDTVITIEGKPHHGPTSCMEGIAIDVTKWEPSDQKCTDASLAAKPWDRVRELKSGTELRIVKRRGSGPILAVMDEANNDRIIVIVKNEQIAIDRDDIDRLEARPRSPSRVTKQTRVANDTGSEPASVGPQPQYTRPAGPGGSVSTSYGIGSKPDFETIYNRPAK